MYSSRDEQDLQRLTHFKQGRRVVGEPLGAEMVSFFKQSVERRQTKLTKIAEVWSRLVPEFLDELCALEGYCRGSLRVMVDSASHL